MAAADAPDLSRTCQEIVPGLWLGPIACANDAAYLRQLGITHRVTCLAEALDPVHLVTTLHVAIRDNNEENIAPFFVDSSPFIAAALSEPQNKVLVHCSSGASRSTTIILAYLVAHRKFTLRDALRLVSEKRSCVLPATTFYAALQTLDVAVHGGAASSATLTDYNVQQLRAITSRSIKTCERALSGHGGSVEDALDALFLLQQRSPSVPDEADLDSADESVLVFTYGTLMRGYHNHVLMERANAEFLGLYQTTQKIALFAAGVPFVNPALARDQILGELFRVKRESMPSLDRLEGHPEFYVRKLTEVEPQAAGDRAAPVLKAWLYFNPFVSDLADSLVPAVYIKTGNFHDAAKFNNPGSLGN